MPHDISNKELKAGDRVLMFFDVVAVHAEGDFCNAELRSVEVMPGNGYPLTVSAVNTRQLVKV